MGVHGLWQLLAPVGRRVSNEHVRNKVLAVDVSIWLTQLVKAMRDAEGARVRNAHLIGVFRRCIKLLFLCVRPVFVFDGATPAIKRRTVASRRAQRERHEAKLRRLAEKILLNRVKKNVVGDAISRKSAAQVTKSTQLDLSRHKSAVDHTTANHAEEEHEIQPLYPTAPRKKFGVSDTTTTSKQPLTQSNAPPVVQPTDEADHFVRELEDDNEQVVLPNDLQQLDDAALVELPTHLQSKVFKQIKQQHRLRHRENMLQQQNNPTQFSKTQIEGFLRHTALNRRISNVRNVINDNAGVTNRIASDSRREFVFEEFQQPDHQSLHADTDSEDDILHPSSANKASAMAASDVLSRIRAAKERVGESTALRTATTKQKERREQQSFSGVGWASRVLSGHGGLELSTMTFRQQPRAPSEEDDLEDEEEALQWRHDAINGAHQDHAQKPLPATPAQHNDSDSDDIEWEDGAAKSDSENSQRSFEWAPSFTAMPQEETNLAEANNFVTSVATEGNDFSATKGVMARTSESDTKKQIPESNRTEKQNMKHLIRQDSQDAPHDVQQVPKVSADATTDLETSGEPCSMQESKSPGPSSTSPAAQSVEEEVLKQNQNWVHAHASDTHISNMYSSESTKKQPSSMPHNNAEKQKPSSETAVGKFQSPNVIGQTDSILASKVVTGNAGGRRKSRTVDEEDNDIQLAIALSLKENVTNLPQSSENDRSSPLRVEKMKDQDPTEHAANKDEDSVTGSGETVHDTPKAWDQQFNNVRFEMSSKPAVVNNDAVKETTSAAELEGEGQNQEGEITLMEMERLYAELDTEAQQFKKQRDAHVGAVETISDEMYSETRDLLKLLGIPYLEAPMEAEAQCAFLNTAKVVDGVITEDSDAFLFGASVVYRQLFADGRFAETYEARDIKSSLGLDREHLIRLAHLLGSDYTPGIRGVGIVNAMEIMEAFPGETGLREFLEWTKKVTVLDKQPEESVMQGTSADAVRRRFCWKHRNMKRNWVIREGFPNRAVTEAYLKPTIDDNRDRFRWREINFDGLARFCWDKFGWERDIFENAVGPLKKELVKRKGPQQTRISEFFKPHRFAKIRSTRLQQAVKGMTGEEAEDIMATLIPRIKRRKTSAMTYNATIDFSPDEEEQILKLLEEEEAKNNDSSRQGKSRQDHIPGG